MTQHQKIIVGVIVLIIIGGILILILGVRPPREQLPEITLYFWGIEESEAFREIIENYQSLHPNVSIIYSQKKIDNYEYMLIDALAAGQGPDILMIHHTWLPKHQKKLASLPEAKLSLLDLREAFPEVVEADFVREGRIYGLPLSIDTLALYYNKDIFNSAGIVYPPFTWLDFQDLVLKLTRIDSQGKIVDSAAAIGTSSNINRATDILALLMLQQGAPMTNPERTQATFAQKITFDGESFSPGQAALEFYTQFATPGSPYYTWDESLHYSIDAFSEGKTAMMFNYAYHLNTVRYKNPYLNFGVSPMPQPSAAGKQVVNYANYWGFGVSALSRYPAQAWDFILYLVNVPQAEIYLKNTQKPPALRFLIQKYLADPNLGVFAKQALTARSWWQVDNSAIEKIFANMINSILRKRRTPEQAVKEAEDNVNYLMRE